jgi:hypothetical protein
MAIASFLVQVAEDCLGWASEEASGLLGVSVVDAGESGHFVVLAEMAASALPGLEGRLRAIPGVIGVTTAMLSVEDELTPAAGDGERA